MKKIEKEMLRAILEGRSWHKSNTKVLSQNGWAKVFLFGNQIAQVDTKTDTVYISTGGWRTITTKSRLNAILRHFTNYKVFQKKFMWFIEDVRNNKRAYWGHDYTNSVLKVTHDCVQTTDGEWPAMLDESQLRLREIERMKNSCEANFKRIKRAAAKKKTLWNNPIFA